MRTVVLIAAILHSLFFTGLVFGEGIVKDLSSITPEASDIGEGWLKDREKIGKDRANLQYRYKFNKTSDLIDVDIKLCQDANAAKIEWTKIKDTMKNYPGVIFRELKEMGDDAFAVGSNGSRIYMIKNNVLITLFAFDKHENGLPVGKAFSKKIGESSR